ncbi:MAG: hypothetical protein ACRD2I_03785 [Vicinamibacterales bacterium]
MGGTTLAVLLDCYNLFNSNAAQAATFSSGSGFLRSITVTGPRIVGFGVKYDF